MGIGIVLELQRECLDSDVSITTGLRKAKAIASKLELRELRDWIDSELNGYDCPVADLPEHRKGKGAPKFKNPYHGWCPIMTDVGWFGDVLRTVYLPQPISELETLAKPAKTDILIMQYSAVIQAEIYKQMHPPMECGLHFSKATVASALDFVRNKMLDWTLELEARGITGDKFTFAESEKREAQVVTNHIYGGNIGVIGNVQGDVENSRFFSVGDLDIDALNSFLEQAAQAAAGLESSVRGQVEPILSELSSEVVDRPEVGRIRELLRSLRTILEGASGNLVASALLSAMASSTG